MTRIMILLMVITSLAFNAKAQAHDQGYGLEGDYLYKVTTVRAERGQLEQLLRAFTNLKPSGYYQAAGTTPPFIMRHSQGDQWDFMVITPMKSWTDYYAKDAAQRRTDARKNFAPLWQEITGDVAFAEDLFATGPDLASLQKAYAENGLYHIEMFDAAAGKTTDLYKQRQMENEYLSETGQIANMIFEREVGSNVDVFTIGFHKDFKTFSADAPVTADEKEAAAKAAGFKDRADLSFYLRSLISAHHDTFATKVE